MSALNQITTIAVLGTVVLMNTNVLAKERTTGRGHGGMEPAPTVFVTSQNLYYDSIVVADPLPMRGNFQQLIPSTNGLETEFGPGDQGHLGGRWWIDINESGYMDEGDKFFLCPLLGPGRETL